MHNSKMKRKRAVDQWVDIYLTEAEKQIQIKQEREFKKKVYRKWKGVCYICGQKCSKHETNLHHLSGRSWAKLDRINVENAVVVHKRCHKRYHKYYNHKRSSKWMLVEFVKVNYPENYEKVK